MVEHGTVAFRSKTLEGYLPAEEEHSDLGVDIEDKIDEEEFPKNRLRDMLCCLGDHLHVLEFSEEMESSYVSDQEDDRHCSVEAVLSETIYPYLKDKHVEGDRDLD